MSVEARVASLEELPVCHEIRREVFIEGQNVAPEIERDGRDDVCTHVLVFVDDEPAGTARLRVTEEGTAKAERVAVRPKFQRRGLGHRVMDVLESEARRLGHGELLLGAQSYIVPFYEQRGYVAYGDEYVEADIPHRKMRLSL